MPLSSGHASSIAKALTGAFPDNYFSRLNRDRSKLTALIDTISNINTIADKSQDVVGRVYEYFLEDDLLGSHVVHGSDLTPTTPAGR